MADSGPTVGNSRASPKVGADLAARAQAERERLGQARGTAAGKVSYLIALPADAP